MIDTIQLRISYHHVSCLRMQSVKSHNDFSSQCDNIDNIGERKAQDRARDEKVFIFRKMKKIIHWIDTCFIIFAKYYYCDYIKRMMLAWYVARTSREIHTRFL
jgi:hypothetical protein